MKCKLWTQALIANQLQASGLNHIVNQFWLGAGKRTQMSALVLLLGLGGGVWFTKEALAPQIAQAEASRINLSLERQFNETFASLAQRAALSAAQVAQNSFSQDKKITEVAITVTAQNQGEIAPVLSLHVTRSQWQSNPDPSRWSNYYHNAEALLGFNNGGNTTAQGGTTSPNAQPGQPTSTNPGQNGGGVNTPNSGGGVVNNGTPNNSGNAATTPGQPANNKPGQINGGGVVNNGASNQSGSPASSGRNGTSSTPSQPANNSPLSPGHAGLSTTNSPYTPGQSTNSNPGQSNGNVSTPTYPRRPVYSFPSQTSNPTFSGGRNGTVNTPSFNQPTTTPSTSGQPANQPATNNSSTPEQSTGQSGITNSTPSNTTPAPGTGMTPTPPTTAPVGSPSSPSGSSPADGSSPGGGSTPANGQVAPPASTNNGSNTGTTTPGS